MKNVRWISPMPGHWEVTWEWSSFAEREVYGAVGATGRGTIAAKTKNQAQATWKRWLKGHLQTA